MTAGEPFEHDHRMKLVARIEIAQDGQPASYGTLRETLEAIITDAIQDQGIRHYRGTALITVATVTIEEGDA